MAGFTSYDDLISEMTVNGKVFTWDFYKLSSAPEGAGIWHSLWTATGTPGPGATPAETPGTAYDDASGSMFFPDTLPDTKHIVTFGALSTVALNLVLYDRLVSVNAEIGTTGAKTINSVALPRYTSGVGVVPVVEYSTASTAAGSFNLSSYTNESGTPGRTGGTVVPPVAAMNIMSLLWLPTDGADRGVRSIETLSVATAATSARVNVSLIKPLVYLPLPANTWVERDLVLQLSSLPRLYDGASLGIAYVATTTSINTIYGQIRVAYG